MTTLTYFFKKKVKIKARGCLGFFVSLFVCLFWISETKSVYVAQANLKHVKTSSFYLYGELIQTFDLLLEKNRLMLSWEWVPFISHILFKMLNLEGLAKDGNPSTAALKVRVMGMYHHKSVSEAGRGTAWSFLPFPKFYLPLDTSFSGVPCANLSLRWQCFLNISHSY